MTKLCIFIGSIAGSSIGWWAGEPVGLGTALLLSSIGTMLGVYGGLKLGRYLAGK